MRETFFKTFFKSFKAGHTDGTVGRTYFTGGLPITLDDLSSGFNAGTPVQLDEALLGLVGFTQKQVETYMDDIFAEHALDPSLETIASTGFATASQDKGIGIMKAKDRPKTAATKRDVIVYRGASVPAIDVMVDGAFLSKDRKMIEFSVE